MQEAEDLSDRERQYQNQITELEQQIRLLKEQVDFLPRKLYGTKSEKTSALDIEGQMSLFNETEYFADPNAKEPELVEVEKHLRKRKYTGQREELIKDLPHSKVLHTIDESEQVCEKCGSSMVKVGEEFVCTEVQFIGKLTSTDPAGNRERHIWKKHRFHIRRSCIPLHPHPRSHG